MSTELLEEEAISQKCLDCQGESNENLVHDEVELLFNAKPEDFIETSPKIIDLTGDPALFPSKARKTLGDTELDSESLHESNKRFKDSVEQNMKNHKKRIEEVVNLRPTPEQLSLPDSNKRVSAKALLILGDENLAMQSRRVLTEKEKNVAEAHPKVFKILGDPAVHSSASRSPKLLSRLGSDMNVAQLRALAKSRHEDSTNRKRRQQEILQEALNAMPTEEQLSLPPRAKEKLIPEKALRFFGDENLNEQARRIVTPKMRQSLNARTHKFFGETALLSEKERQLLGELDLPGTQPKRYIPSKFSNVYSTLSTLLSVR